MIKGLGCDVCQIARMEKYIEGERFLARFFMAEERAYIAARVKSAQTAAGLFAAKEAFVKALGTGFGTLSPGDIGVTHDAAGMPAYALGASAREAMIARGALRAFLSISHDGGVAMAVCVLEGE